MNMSILEEPVHLIPVKYPALSVFFETYGLSTQSHDPLKTYLDKMDNDFFEDIGIDRENLIENLKGLLKHSGNLNTSNNQVIKSIRIIGGTGKLGNKECVDIILQKGTVTSIVGPTGSGKSRLLADIEWIAQGDTPTGRIILINEKKPDTNIRFSPEHKLVAQLSQNMNFVMDTSVAEFIAMHAESRFISNHNEIVKDIIFQANLLAGEPFNGNTPITSLSGGQSRALMIADTAFLSVSPVVLIDEIENAGIDRKKAVVLLVKKEKIVLIATHDPILALMADQRMIIKNGAIVNIIKTSEREKQNLEALQILDNKNLELRNQLRKGERLEDSI
jgi:ABC-type lipoprotein export system ATPase subunit